MSFPQTKITHELMRFLKCLMIDRYLYELVANKLTIKKEWKSQYVLVTEMDITYMRSNLYT